MSLGLVIVETLQIAQCPRFSITHHLKLGRNFLKIIIDTIFFLIIWNNQPDCLIIVCPSVRLQAYLSPTHPVHYKTLELEQLTQELHRRDTFAVFCVKNLVAIGFLNLYSVKPLPRFDVSRIFSNFEVGFMSENCRY